MQTGAGSAQGPRPSPPATARVVTGVPEAGRLRTELAVARGLAWALLLAGWLVLGVMGRRHWPLLAGGQVPLAAWLLCIGLAMAWLRQRASISVRHLRIALPATAAVLIGSLFALQRTGQGAWLMATVVAWAGLLVAASCSVRAWRSASPTRPPAPLRPALFGGALAVSCCWPLLEAGGGQLNAGVLLLPALVGGWLAWRLPDSPQGLRACRTGLFDCAWPVPAAAAWRQALVMPWRAPRVVSMMGMLPMMVGLAPMSEACASEWGLPLAASATLHLVAMLLPATLLRPWLAGLGARQLGAWLLVLLLLAGASAWAWPGLVGLMLAGLLQALAWSLAWAAPMVTPSLSTGPATGHGPVGGVGQACVAAGVALGLGFGFDHAGPAALGAVAIALALCALGATMATSTFRQVLPSRRAGIEGPVVQGERLGVDRGLN